MPTNLNALIRYKTIDKCLGSRSMKCTIRRLQEECSEALGEKRGIYKMVSERTIRDDIRVMRSDILGFNAPIAFEEGCYFYTERNYSIFETYIESRELLHSIYQLLLVQRESVKKSDINYVLFCLSTELNIGLPPQIYAEYLAERKLRMSEKSDENTCLSIRGFCSDPEQSASERPTSFSFVGQLDSKAVIDESESHYSIKIAPREDAHESDAAPEAIECFFPWRFILTLLRNI